MNPRFLRAVLVILSVRAIFISPALGSEYGSSHRPGDSAMKRLESIRPSRLRFTRPNAPSASQERIDCIDGGDGDDGDDLTSIEGPSFALDSRARSTRRPLTPSPSSTAHSLVRLRC